MIDAATKQKVRALCRQFRISAEQLLGRGLLDLDDADFYDLRSLLDHELTKNG